MKRTILILIAMLIAVGITLSILGSGGEYGAEKLFYRAMKVNSKIIMNPEVAPPRLLARVENDLKKLTTKYPATIMARTGNIALVEFYIMHKDYDKAGSVVAGIMKDYKDDNVILSTAQFLKGVIYEKRNEWPDALREFNALRDKYPTSQLGVQIPLYIAKYYETKGKEAEAKEAYSDAQLFYGKMEEEYRGKNLGYIASFMLIRAYLGSRDYVRAGDTLKYALDTYPSSVSYNQLLPLVNTIFVEKLNSPKKAAEIYRKVRDKLPARSRLKKTLDTVIKKTESEGESAGQQG